MNIKPMELTLSEKQEIASIEGVREMWGAVDHKEMLQLFNDSIYSVKFDFISGSPGYCGDLFTLHGDALGEPVSLIRDDNGVLKII